MSEVAQAVLAPKADAAPAVGTEGAALGGSTRTEDAVPLTDAELEELAKIIAESRAEAARERARKRARKRAIERARKRAIYETENAWRDVEIVVSNVVKFYTYDPSKAAPAEKQPPGPVADATS